MSILVYVIFVIFIFFSMFVMSPKITIKKNIVIQLSLLGIIIFIAMIFSAFSRSKIEVQSNIIFTIYVSIVITIMINIANQLSHLLVDSIINFHQKFNSNNINKNPIRFLINKKTEIKKNFTIIWFMGSLIMLSGLWFGN